jgi:probable rRNA maturation factor
LSLAVFSFQFVHADSCLLTSVFWSNMISINVDWPFRDPKVSGRGLKVLVAEVCRQRAVSKASVGIAVVGDEQMRGLNRRFTGRRTATDCLSFDLSDGQGPGAERVFEIVVNAERAIREASARGHRPQAELALYITHGLLHQLGFDDLTPVQARRMHRREDEILQGLGYGIVYQSER